MTCKPARTAGLQATMHFSLPSPQTVSISLKMGPQLPPKKTQIQFAREYGRFLAIHTTSFFFFKKIAEHTGKE